MKMRVIKSVMALAVALGLGLLAYQNKFLCALPWVKPGMTEKEVGSLLGNDYYYYIASLHSALLPSEALLHLTPQHIRQMEGPSWSSATYGIRILHFHLAAICQLEYSDGILQRINWFPQ